MLRMIYLKVLDMINFLFGELKDIHGLWPKKILKLLLTRRTKHQNAKMDFDLYR